MKMGFNSTQYIYLDFKATSKNGDLKAILLDSLVTKIFTCYQFQVIRLWPLNIHPFTTCWWRTPIYLIKVCPLENSVHSE